jgi:hypothetical protein
MYYRIYTLREIPCSSLGGEFIGFIFLNMSLYFAPALFCTQTQREMHFFLISKYPLLDALEIYSPHIFTTAYL